MGKNTGWAQARTASNPLSPGNMIISRLTQTECDGTHLKKKLLTTRAGVSDSLQGNMLLYYNVMHSSEKHTQFTAGNIVGL